jgi:hypothetical protein
MNHHCHNASIHHLYGYVDRSILRGLDPAEAGKFDKAVVFGVTSIPSRALHFSIMCESGAQWARIPLHMLRHEMPIKGGPVHDLNELQMWDCHGWDFSVTRYEYLREMTCQFKKRNGQPVPATYWFTLDHTDNGYSNYPPEHKCYHVLLLNDGSGQIAAQPNNRIVWKDDSWVKPGLPLDYRVMAPQIWCAETSRKNAQDTAMTKD